MVAPPRPRILTLPPQSPVWHVPFLVASKLQSAMHTFTLQYHSSRNSFAQNQLRSRVAIAIPIWPVTLRSALAPQPLRSEVSDLVTLWSAVAPQSLKFKVLNLACQCQVVPFPLPVSSPRSLSSLPKFQPISAAKRVHSEFPDHKAIVVHCARDGEHAFSCLP